jgi:hypothetical protein
MELKAFTLETDKLQWTQDEYDNSNKPNTVVFGKPKK